MIRFQGISKRFPGVQALRDVTLTVPRGVCHALVGENGAGKSTLGKVLAGIHTPDAGELLIAGRPVRFRSPREARAAGVGVVHQELALCGNLSVAENLCLGRLPCRGPFVARGRMEAQAQAALGAIGVDLPVATPVAGLPVSLQQLVQIAGAVAGGARILVFDEPTSSLSGVEVQRLFALIRRLTAQGVTSIYVSHRLEEVFDLCGTVTVLRDGRVVGTQPTAALDRGRLVQLMVGRQIAVRPAGPVTVAGQAILRVAGLASPGRFAEVSFEVRAGEIVGLAGLVGAGRTELLQALFGLDPDARGRVVVDGRAADLRHPAAAMASGFGLAPEDRKRHGLVLGMGVLENLTLPTLRRFARLGWVRRAAERRAASQQVAALGIRAPRLATPAAALSGGNQQKLVLGKWLAARCCVLLLDEPTRGVDVAAKAQIHDLIRALARAGSAILMASSELPEILQLCDRILVMRRGRLVAAMPAAQATEEAVLRPMAGL